MLANRQTADSMAAPGDKAARVNLLNWDGRGTPQGIFPPKEDA
jgi:nitrate reductase / nitrite oxidoreductase, beta subunit